MPQVLVNFGGGYAAYQILVGYIDADGRLRSNPLTSRVRIKLPIVSKVTEVRFAYTGPGAFYVGIRLLSDSLVSRVSNEDMVRFSGTYRKTYDVSNVRYIECTVTRTHHNYSYQMSLDNCLIIYEPADVAEIPCVHEQTDCAVGIYGMSQPFTAQPVGLRDGDKSEQVTDLTLNSLAAPLEFVRSYRQSKLGDTDFPQVMALGWSHNHNLYLDTTSTPGTIFAYLSEGGRAQFDQQSSNRYVASAGGTSTITMDSSSTVERYLLETDDQSWSFDVQCRLRFRRWTSGETWTYIYYEIPHFAAGKLKEIDDGYGRKLQFAYVDNSGGFNDLQLWRVGDQDATGLDGSNPIGRYVEYTYVEEHENGLLLSTNARPLLQQVRDVKGQTWRYQYYGYESGEDVTDQLNFLTRCRTPQVDTDGDGSPDTLITQKALQYSLLGGSITALTQARGIHGSEPALLTTDYAFQPSDDLTTETVAGKTTNHYFLNGVYIGPQDPQGNQSFQFQNGTYRPFQQQDANGGSTKLEWSENGKRLDKVTDALNHETQFVYDTQDRLIQSMDAEGRLTEYTYGDASIPRQPTVIRVFDSDGTTLLRWQEFDYDNRGRTLEERTIDPTDGTTALQRTTRIYHASGNGNGLLASITQVDTQDPGNNQSTSYTYDSAGRVIKTQKSSVFGGCDISFIVYDPGGNVVASICNYDPGLLPDPTSAAEAAALYNPAQPNKNRVTAHDYDEMGRRVATTVNAGSDFAQTSRTLYDALDRPWREIANYTNTGYSAPGTWVWNGHWQDAGGTTISHGADHSQNLITETRYNARGLPRLRRDVMGNVTLYGYDDADRLIKTIQNASDPDYGNDYITGDPDLSDYDADESQGDVDIIVQQSYDPGGNLIRSVDPLGSTTLTSYDALNRPIEVVSSASNPNYNLLGYGNFGQYSFVDAPDRDLRRTTTYDALGRTLETRQLIAQTGSAVTWITTRSVYDELGRLRLTVNNYVDQGENPAQWVWNENEANWQRSDGTPIGHGINRDQNLISQQVYDEAGRVRFTRDMAGTKNWSVYDGLGRQIRQITGCTYTSGSPAPEDPGYTGDVEDPAADVITETFYNADGRAVKTRRLLHYDKAADELIWVWTLTGYDSLGRQVKTVQNASNAEYPIAADPDLSEYAASANSDEDLITETAYDALGRGYRRTDASGRATLTGYDSAGRVVKTIQNASQANYDVTSDPDLSDYIASADPDEDLVTETFYDLAGRVVKTIDPAESVTLNGYDRLGRLIRTIRNASNPTYYAAIDADLSGYISGYTAYNDGDENPITNADEDRITDTIYDKAGRVIRTIDAAQNHTLTMYDRAGRVIETIRNASNTAYVPGSGTYIPSANAESDQDRITSNVYDKGGRLISTTDDADVTTYYVYDRLGRRIRSITGYLMQGTSDPANWTWSNTYGRWEDGAGNPLEHGDRFDRNLISATRYDLLGRVSETRDARGILTTFTYDRLGRRLIVREAVGTALETVRYTCYDKAGRIERHIQNWQDSGISPDEKDASGNWVFDPVQHGALNDQNLITQYAHDRSGRTIAVSDPEGNIRTTTYFRDGQIATETDAEGTVTLYRYDGMRRRVLVVQGYVPNGEDPALWTWDNGRWETSGGTAIVHGQNNDQNVIVQIALDKAGRMIGLRDPRGNITAYEYDGLGRRTRLNNPLNNDWLTEYKNLPDGRTKATTTNPGLSSGGTYNVERVFDRLGRPLEIEYGDATTTPLVTFAYDGAGNRAAMREYNSSGQIRKTEYLYDDARRLSAVGFDIDGDDAIEEGVSYEYDLGGLRTRMTLPDNLSISYRYDARGQLVGLTDWDGQASDFFYDKARRHVGTQRPGSFASIYRYNLVGHLQRIEHSDGGKSLARFVYTVDGRGSRTEASERLARQAAVVDTIGKDDEGITYRGVWVDDGDFKMSTQFSAQMTLAFVGQDAALIVGTGPDHGIFDVYVDGSLWESFDGYAETAGERVINLHLTRSGLVTFEIRNRATKNLRSSGYRVRFHALVVLETAYDERTIRYTYDALSRLIEANYNNGAEVLTYGFDLAGNLTNLNGVSRSYNAANQMTHDGTNTLTYDANGNMTSDGVNAYTWDRANRLLSMGGISYQYNGDGNRIQQDALRYILDLQPGLAQVIGDSGGNRFVHGPSGIHAAHDGATWAHPLTDGLGSVRGYVDLNGEILSTVHYSDYGVPDAPIVGPAFTGEWRDVTGVQYHRARYLSPELGSWLSFDPFEGISSRPMSLNKYSWVEGNVVNLTDANGMCVEQDICARLLGQGGVPRSVLESLGCLSPSSPPESYVIGFGLPTPRITNPQRYGQCASRSSQDRPGCAVQAYLGAVADPELQAYGADGTSMPWELFIALTMSGEGSIYYIDPNLPNHEHFELRFSPSITQLRTDFENAIVCQIFAACGGTTCTEDDFVKLMGGPPANQWGIQAWYQAAIPGNGVNLNDLKATWIVSYRYFLNNLVERPLTQLSPGCGPVRWGNANHLGELELASSYASYISPAATYGKVDPADPNRVYFWVR